MLPQDYEDTFIAIHARFRQRSLGSFSLGLVRALWLFSLTIGCALLLASCTPRQDLVIFNAADRSIMVAALGQTVLVAPRDSTQFAFILARGQHPEAVSVTSSGARTWRYPEKLFLRIPTSSWHAGPFDSRRAFLSVDPHGSISLCSPTGFAVPQPAGFPLRPEGT
jgi:hypothetical protein